MSTKKSILVPRLQLPKPEPFLPMEMSPRSDEMNEEISSIRTTRSFSLAPDQTQKSKLPRTCKANTPLNTCVQKSDKNPLLRQTSTFIGLSSSMSLVQTNDSASILLENLSLKQQLHKQEQELKQLRRMKVLLRQKEMQLERTELSLKLTMQESEQLAQELRHRQQEQGSAMQTLGDDEEPKVLSNSIHLGSYNKSDIQRKDWSRMELSMQKFKRKLQSHLASCKE
mmetsp:Transcript_3879/g.8150  ORF Transcript_3879/g.8150 Transcript_3879/m.8150 type:complete len:226 (-) Transcript_3879:160-837(-)